MTLKGSHCPYGWIYFCLGEPTSTNGRDGARKKNIRASSQASRCPFSRRTWRPKQCSSLAGQDGHWNKIHTFIDCVLSFPRITTAGKVLDLNCLVSCSSWACAPCSPLCTNLVSYQPFFCVRSHGFLWPSWQRHPHKQPWNDWKVIRKILHLRYDMTYQGSLDIVCRILYHMIFSVSNWQWLLQHVQSLSQLAFSSSSKSWSRECPAFNHISWMDSGTWIFPLGFLSHKRLRRFFLAARDKLPSSPDSEPEPWDMSGSDSSLPPSQLGFELFEAAVVDGDGREFFGVFPTVGFFLVVFSRSKRFPISSSCACIRSFAYRGMNGMDWQLNCSNRCQPMVSQQAHMFCFICITISQ